MKQIVTQSYLDKGISYAEYRALTDELIEAGKTTGPNQSEAYIEYTRLNGKRMKRLDKQAELSDRLQALISGVEGPWYWLVLTEAWCGDAAQNLPILDKMEASSPAITMRLLMREENPELMDEFLTNGGRSIPKLVCLNKKLEVLGTWGPRPKPAQQLLVSHKADPNKDNSEIGKALQQWYNQDKNQTLDQEFQQLIMKWNNLD